MLLYWIGSDIFTPQNLVSYDQRQDIMKLMITFGHRTFPIELDDNSMSTSTSPTLTYSMLKEKILNKFPSLRRENGFQIGLNSTNALQTKEEDIIKDLGIVSGDRIFIFDSNGRLFGEEFLQNSNFEILQNSVQPETNANIPDTQPSQPETTRNPEASPNAPTPHSVPSEPVFAEPVFARPLMELDPNQPNRLRVLAECCDRVPLSFQQGWETLLQQRKGNVGLLDGFVFVTDTLMWEEGFHKIPEPEMGEKESVSIRRSYYSHLPPHLSGDTRHCCLLVFSSSQTSSQTSQTCHTQGTTSILIQASIGSEFRSRMSASDVRPVLNIPIATRYWISNAFSGCLRSEVFQMYRNLPELSRLIKDAVVLKLQAIIAHGLRPVVLLGMEALPLEILEKIVLACRPPDAAHLSQTCKRISRVMEPDIVWKQMARRYFKPFRGLTDADIRENHGSWRQVFIAEWKAQRQEQYDSDHRRVRNSELFPIPTNLDARQFDARQLYLPFPAPIPNFDDDFF